MPWFEETYKLVIEERQSHYKILAMLAPLSRSPFGKEDGAALKKYSENVNDALERMTPWRGTRRRIMKESGLVPGEIQVRLTDGDSVADPLYKGAKIANKS